MKKIIFMSALSLFLLSSTGFSQNGRPKPLETTNKPPKITVRNDNDPTSIELGKISNRLSALETKVSNLENENTSLKTQNADLQKKITDLSSAQQANYKVLDYSLSQLNKKFTTQVGTFRINGFVGSQSLLASGASSKFVLLTGVHE